MLPPWTAPLVAVVTLVTFTGRTARDVWSGRTTINRVTWALWAAIPAVAGAASLTAGAGWAAASVFAAGAGPAVVLTASLAGPGRDHVWQASVPDKVCAALSVLAVAGWLATGQGVVAVALAVVADALAAAPTVHKAYVDPASESPWAYVGALVNSVVGLAVLDTWAPTTVAFPAYVGALSVVVLVLVGAPRGHARHGGPAAPL